VSSGGSAHSRLAVATRSAKSPTAPRVGGQRLGSRRADGGHPHSRPSTMMALRTPTLEAQLTNLRPAGPAALAWLSIRPGAQRVTPSLRCCRPRAKNRWPTGILFAPGLVHRRKQRGQPVRCSATPTHSSHRGPRPTPAPPRRHLRSGDPARDQGRHPRRSCLLLGEHASSARSGHWRSRRHQIMKSARAPRCRAGAGSGFTSRGWRAP